MTFLKFIQCLYKALEPAFVNFEIRKAECFLELRLLIGNK